ncbi:MAG: UvrD-helicase domain-containing protein [Sphaerochaetaceae bacterium]|jgi:mRNA-degrading endonuclease RelE of RelBE toxin-antitoxin system|nr:UvrD-helicase domain-containing protein [Sphaerochaetaceae bacterium]
MESTTYLLLLNEQLKKDLLRLSAKERRRVFEKLSFLENGMWDAGVRVKKLKGPTDKVIFEARISKGDRLIFTLGRDGERTCIYLWGAVHHDNISSTARTIFPDNAPFLHFETASEETFDDLMIDSLSDDVFTQESIEQKVLEDYGPQKWMDISEEQLKRFLGRNNPDFFELFLYLTREQQDVLKLKPPVLLSGTAGSGKTTLAIYYLMKGSHTGQEVLFVTCSHFLRDYSEKLYRGLTVHSPLENEIGEVRFAMLRELVLEILSAAKIHPDLKQEVDLKGFIEIFSRHSLAKQYDPELVWEEIRSIIKGANPPVSLRHYRTLISLYLDSSLTTIQLRQLKDALLALKAYGFSRKFERIIEKKSSCIDFTDFVQKLSLPNQQADYTTFAFILGEILRILVMKENHLSSPLLSLEEYTNLGKKRAPNFLYDRQEIYNIAEYYQGQLEAEKRFDEIDLCRRAIVALEQLGNQFQWDLVVGDEVQDFSDIQLTLLFKLSKKPGEIVCAGDPKQIINPSGFRWEELKNRFYEQGLPVPTVQHLHLNFRCVGSVVRLSNALLKLKQQLVGISGHEQMEEWKFNGRPPYLIHGISEVEMSREVATTAAGQVILVRSDGEKQRLMKTLNTELVFTINEAKGLEFDTVLLWKFSSDAKASSIWRKIHAENYLETRHYPLIRHEINLLYVAVTRARNTLIIYDGARTSPVWQVEALAPHIFNTQEKDALQQIWKRISTAKEWNEQGDYFFERQHYSVAAECYRNSLNDEMGDVCQAYIKRSEKLYLASAALFLSRGRKAEAAHDYEDGGAYHKALPLWKDLKRKDRIIPCEISLLETEGKYAEAADLWVQQKRFDRAVENWKKAKAFSKLGSYYFKLRSYSLAGENFVSAGQFLEAALCYKRLKQPKKAANYYVAGGDYEKALPLYIRLKAWDDVIICYTALDKHYQLGLLYEKRKEYKLAIEKFTLYANGSKEQKTQLLDEAKKMETISRSMIKAGIRYAAMLQHSKAADLFFYKNQFELAVVEYLQVGDLHHAAICYNALGKTEHAIKLYEEIGDKDSYIKVIDLLRSRMRKGRRYDQNQIQACYETAEFHYRTKEYSKALTRYLAINETDGILKSALLVAGRDEEVLDFFMQEKESASGIEFITKKKDLTISKTYVEQLCKSTEYRVPGVLTYHVGEQLLLELLAKLSAKKKSPYDLSEIIRIYLASYGMLYQVDQVSKAFVNLIIDTQYLNHIFLIVTESVPLEKSFVDQFKKQILARAVSSNDALLMALAQESLPSTLDPLLEDLPIDIHNYLLFSLSPKRSVEAFDFLKQSHVDISKIEDFCFKAELLKDLALLHEQAENYKRAAGIYKENGDLFDALRCYTRIEDFLGIAKTFEAMHRFEDALVVYTKLEKSAAIARMKKKLNKLQYIQKELF